MNQVDWRRRISLLFGLRTPVSRRTYFVTGLLLFAVKYAVDLAIVFAFTREPWKPVAYLMLPWSWSLPSSHDRAAMMALLAVWALPFAWIGIAMSMRRCIDAGVSPRCGLVFFVPMLNLLMILALCVIPTKERPPVADRPVRLSHRWGSMLSGTIAGVVVLVGAMAFSVFGLGAYGAALFVGAPFLGGFVAASVLNRRPGYVALGESISAALASLCVASTAILLVAWEGIFCLLMALPPAALMATLGAWIGHGIAKGPVGSSAVVALLLCWPGLTVAEARGSHPKLREVLSVVEVDRPPASVWPHVIEFRELPEPTEWFFRAGIAYPKRARIEGTGVGAVRYCEFSTGPFVEPITAWDAPTRLAFDVIDQPQPMSELSPYREVLAPHLEGNLQSHRGEFRLAALPRGRTLIEARTWYTVDMYPSAYWYLWSDAIIHRIHMRVLEHIRAETMTSGLRHTAKLSP